MIQANRFIGKIANDEVGVKLLMYTEENVIIRTATQLKSKGRGLFRGDSTKAQMLGEME